MNSKVNSILLQDWKEKTKVFICRIYNETSTQYKQFSNISAYPSIITPRTQPDVPKAVRKAKNLLNGFIEDIENFGLPINTTIQNNTQKNSIPNINIENNPIFTQTQSQNQNQTQSQTIDDIIRDEIPPSKMREIEAILKTKESEKTKLEKIEDVLQKVGICITSSVLAKIITTSLGIF